MGLSTMLATDLTTVASHRQTEPGKLATLLRGDLDWIVMKALEKDRKRRYETADGLASDVQRHLHTEPVTARPPSSLYRFQKLIRRNKLLFTSAGAIATALTVGLVVSTWMFVRERQARERAVIAEREQNRLLKNVLTAQVREATARAAAEQRLYDSIVSEARATRATRLVGYRDKVFSLLKQAKELSVPKKDLADLRREAEACLGDFVGLTPTTRSA